ncbi:autoinducer binding domain-containing protein [Mesorhizobium sp. M0854]|uniref:autoinducer binding domain-containing protein n=1 Tax=Mesorhizobium sp. M0854 TaxID=2957013 RepID=UPI00333594AF
MRIPNGKPTLIPNYPAPWTARYLENRYQIVDPVIIVHAVAVGPGKPDSVGSSWIRQGGRRVPDRRTQSLVDMGYAT